MERMSRKERFTALEIINAETDHFVMAKGRNPAGRWLSQVERIGAELHRLYEGECSVDLGTAGNATRRSRAESLERELRSLFAKAGLGLYLNSDPRGNPVGILTPKTGRYNTMGGAEDGWRL